MTRLSGTMITTHPHPIRAWGWLFPALVVAGACGPVDGPPALADPAAPAWSEPGPASYVAEFETTAGRFSIQVKREWAPLGADRFYQLVRAGFFDEQRFTRVVPEFICQWGIHGDPTVSIPWRASTLRDDPVIASNIRGRIAYAMTGPDTRSTQVYINLVDNVRLDEQGFAPFGEVVDGLDVVDSIFSGYAEDAGGGMRRGEQDPLFEGGNAYIDAEYPDLDHIIRAHIVEEVP